MKTRNTDNKSAILKITNRKFANKEFDAPNGNHSLANKKETANAITSRFAQNNFFSYLGKYCAARLIPPSKIRVIPIQAEKANSV